jgi:pimeloyl-ACP methyl ester carboxylesterase
MTKAINVPDFLKSLFTLRNRPALAAGPVPGLSQAEWNGTKKELRLSTGIAVKYVEAGKLDGPPVVLIHGMADSSRSWSLTTPFLGQGYRLIMPDLRGHGGSDKPDTRDYPVSLHASDIAALIDGLGLKKAFVAGHSLGSMIAQALAINYPEKALKIALVSSALVASGDIFKEIYSAAKGFGENGPDDEFLELFYSNPTPVDGELIKRMTEEAKAVPVHSWRAITKGMACSYLPPVMDELTAPTLILWGSADSIFGPEYQEALKGALPSARFIAYEGRGHNIHWELAEKVASDIAAFFGN